MKHKGLSRVLTLALILVLVCSAVQVYASGPDQLAWAKSAGDVARHDDDTAFGIATDKNGNSLVTGSFKGTAIFGAGEANETTLTSAGERDIFVAKFDHTGASLWAKSAGGIADLDQGVGIATDEDGNSLVTGSFRGAAAIFGAGEANETTLIGAGQADFFIAKYDPTGALLWVKSAGQAQNGGGRGIATDSAGNSLVTGPFRGTVTYGAGEANETTLTSAGEYDNFVAKYDPNGALLWARQDGGTESDYGRRIATDQDDNSIVTGLFEGTATFGAGEATETTLTSGGDFDIFVAKYDANGALLWAKSAGGSSQNQGNGIASDGDGNSLVTGQFEGTATFGAGEATETTLTSAGYEDVFVAKYDANGALLWAKRAGGTSRAFGYGIATDSAGNSLVTGKAGVIFVAKYDPDGALLWERQDGGSVSQTAYDIAIDSAGNSLVTGYFAGNVVWGAGEANETILSGGAAGDIFVAKYDGPGAELTIVPPAVEIYPGDTVEVDLDVSDAVDLYGLQAQCTVDPAVLETQSGVFGDLLDPANRLIGANTADAGAGTWFGGASLQSPAAPVTGAGLFATITYQALIPGSSDITCDPLASDIDGFELDISSFDSAVTVLPYGNIVGTATYQGRLDHSAIDVEAVGGVSSADTTDAAGAFDLIELRNGSYDVTADAPLYLPNCASGVTVVAGQTTDVGATTLRGGDANNDDQLSIGDATLVGANFGLNVPPGAADADINADGRVNVQDLAIVGGNFGLSGCQSW